MNALNTLRREHHSIESVLLALSYFVDQIASGRPAPETKVLVAMLHYIELLIDQFHHPREERHLFRLLRTRTHEADALLDQLESEHLIGRERTQQLSVLFRRYEADGPTYFNAFAVAFREFAHQCRVHMRREEDNLFNLAEQVLSEQDWDSINTAFETEGRGEGAMRTSDVLDALFDHILSATPAPIGKAAGLAGAFRPLG